MAHSLQKLQKHKDTQCSALVNSYNSADFPFKGMHLACCSLRRSSVTHLQATVPRKAENTNPLLLKYLIITAERALTPWAYHPLCAPSTVKNIPLLASCEVSAIMQKKLFLSEHAVYWKGKSNIRGYVLRMQKLLEGIMCYFKMLASQRYTACLRHFQEKKRGYV